MRKLHEVLCPTFIDCDLCQSILADRRTVQIENFTGNLNQEDILNKHFYLLEISHQPTRETYFRFSLNPIKKAGRDLINGLSSISGVSNRKWFKMFIESGIKYFSVSQPDLENYPIIKLNFLMYSSKDDLDTRINLQLKYRLHKINKDLDYQLTYIGTYDIDKIMNYVNTTIQFDYNSAPVKKIDIDLLSELNKLKESKPVIFGKQYSKMKLDKQVETV